MERIEKSVFISYRRTNAPWALNVFQYLTSHGYDVFFDYQSIASGDFEQILLANIKARAHFIVILTPSALEGCDKPGDWLRREIETALDTKRNIVPLMLEGFDFGNPKISKYLTGKLAALRSYNGLRVPAEYFPEAMGRLQDQYLNIPLDAVIHPLSKAGEQAVKKQQSAARGAPPVLVTELTAQEWFEKGFALADYSSEEMRCYNEAIRLKPDYVKAYYNRAIVRYNKGDLDGGIADFNEAIRFKPDYTYAYYNRAIAFEDKGDLDGAIADYDEAIRLKPDYIGAYYNRGLVRYNRGDLDDAIADYNEAIRLKPDFEKAYNNRGAARYKKGDLDGAIADYNEAIRLKPDNAKAYNGRGAARYKKGDLDGAIADYNEAIRLKPDNAQAYKNRGLARKNKGDLDGAREDYKEASLINPNLL